MEYTVINDQNGLIAKISKGGMQHTAYIPIGIKREDKLLEIAQHANARFQKNSQTFQPEAAMAENAKFVNEWLVKAMQDVRNDLHTDKRQLVERKERLREPISCEDLNFERAYVASLTDKPSAELASKLTSELDIARTSALLRHDDLRRLTNNAEIIAHVEREHAINRIIEIRGNKFAIHPTLGAPLPIGIDHAAARADAIKQLEEIDRQIEAADDAGRAWASIIAFAAAASGQDVNELFGRIVG